MDTHTHTDTHTFTSSLPLNVWHELCVLSRSSSSVSVCVSSMHQYRPHTPLLIHHLSPRSIIRLSPRIRPGMKSTHTHTHTHTHTRKQAQQRIQQQEEQQQWQLLKEEVPLKQETLTRVLVVCLTGVCVRVCVMCV